MSITNFPNGVSSFGSPIFGSGSVFGKTWFVSKDSGSDDNSGENPSTAFKTITQSLLAAGDNDTVIVAPGQYKEAATLNITQSNFKLLAADTGPDNALTQTEIRQHDNVEVPVITCNVPGFELAGFRITPYTSATSTGLLMGSTANTYGAYIHDNYFYCVESGATSANSIVLGVDDSFDCDSVVIAHNDFYHGSNYTSERGIIEWNSATRCIIRDNMFHQYDNHTTSYAINIYDADGFRGSILDNRFNFSELTVEVGVAVAINNPVAEGGDLMIDGNHFVNYATDDSMIASKNAACLGLNYANATVIAVG